MSLTSSLFLSLAKHYFTNLSTQHPYSNPQMLQYKGMLHTFSKAFRSWGEPTLGKSPGLNSSYLQAIGTGGAIDAGVPGNLGQGLDSPRGIIGFGRWLLDFEFRGSGAVWFLCRLGTLSLQTWAALHLKTSALKLKASTQGVQSFKSDGL